jgi:hypothetical protein
MSHPRTHRGQPLTRAALPLALLLVAVSARADEPRAVVAKSLAPAGTLLRRTAPDKPWEAVEPKADVSSRDLLLSMPVSRATIESKNGAVQVLFWGNLPQISAFPILESAVVLHEAKDADLDLSPQRGRVVLSNHKDKGAAEVRVRLPRGQWDVTLSEPGTEAALEMFGRWPRGVPFQADPKSGEAPTIEVVLLVLKGNVGLKAGGQQFALTAPAGPAYFHWDSVAGSDDGPRRLTDLPTWTSQKLPETPETKAAGAVLAELTRQMQTKAPEAVMAGLAKAADAETDALKAGSMRRGAVYGSAALDNLGPVVAGLADKHADVRDAAVQALRAWIGRGPGQDQKLFDFLQKEEMFSKVHAAMVLELLHSFGDADLEKPETYEALIGYLRHTRPAIRALAAWQLYRLAPQGKDIAYDPAGAREDLDKAYKAWKELVPSGQLPKPKKEK